MIRTSCCFLGTLALAFSLAAPVFASAPQSVLAGYDLYQLDRNFGREFAQPEAPNAAVIIDPPPIGYFDDIAVQGLPLMEYDFGDGMVDVGMADTIVRRLGDAVDDGGGTATVDIELVALSLRSVDPIEVAPDVFDHIYIGLDPNQSSTGQYNFTFFDEPFQEVGVMDASFNVNYEVRIGSPGGTVLETDSIQLDSYSQDVPFSHFPIGLSPFEAPDKLVQGVNFLLDGTQDGDFFQFGFPLSLYNADDSGTDFRYFDMAFQHANSNDPGDTSEDPILPDGSEDGSFIFNDAPQRGWFDPPATSAYLYETDGASNFVSVFLPTFGMVPDADGTYLISSIHGDVSVFAGTGYTFPSAVQSFTISGIDPTVDGGDPLAFPTFLTFDSFSNTFTQTPVPEPTAWLLGLASLTLVASRKR